MMTDDAANRSRNSNLQKLTFRLRNYRCAQGAGGSGVTSKKTGGGGPGRKFSLQRPKVEKSHLSGTFSQVGPRKEQGLRKKNKGEDHRFIPRQKGRRIDELQG